MLLLKLLTASFYLVMVMKSQIWNKRSNPTSVLNWITESEPWILGWRCHWVCFLQIFTLTPGEGVGLLTSLPWPNSTSWNFTPHTLFGPLFSWEWLFKRPATLRKYFQRLNSNKGVHCAWKRDGSPQEQDRRTEPSHWNKHCFFHSI